MKKRLGLIAILFWVFVGLVAIYVLKQRPRYLAMHAVVVDCGISPEIEAENFIKRLIDKPLIAEDIAFDSQLANISHFKFTRGSNLITKYLFKRDAFEGKLDARGYSNVVRASLTIEMSMKRGEYHLESIKVDDSAVSRGLYRELLEKGCAIK